MWLLYTFLLNQENGRHRYKLFKFSSSRTTRRLKIVLRCINDIGEKLACVLADLEALTVALRAEFEAQ